MTRQVENPIIKPKILIVGILSPTNSIVNTQSYFDEFVNLVKSNGIEYDEAVFIKLRQIDPGYYITKGKLEELIEICKKHEIDQVIFSEPISTQQERNLTDILHAKVFDRTQLILDIFEKGAHSAEAKNQVAIAMLKNRKSRVAGHGKGMSQQAGRIGTKGPGETQKEKDIQHIEKLILSLQKDLKKIQQQRQTQRKRRILANIPMFCLVGYTNAGKSTILNLLTQANVLAEDKLFATLDTTTRELYVDGKKIGLISDTVGFIQQLPHHLIEAFKSTLSELQYASLLLHVIDVSDPNWPSHIKVVMETLKDINVDKPMLYIFNKADKIPDISIIKSQVDKFQPNVIISSLSKDRIAPLIEYLKNFKA
ncbi:GTPase HflX [Candidatus Dependentiae bacterium]|nr:GTPase HflX [Candidatus Dependentiae bacterium]